MTTAVANGEARAAALEQAATITLPTKRDEAWRYAPFSSLEKLVFGSVASAPHITDDLGVPQFDGPRIVLVNGVVDAGQSDLASLPTGVHVCALVDSDSSPQPLTPAFAERSALADDAFLVLNTAHAGDGAVITVEAGVAVAPVIHVVHVSVPGQASNTSAARVVIDLGAGASATVVETRVGSGETFGGTSVRTSVALADDAKFEHIVLQDLPASQVHLGIVEVVQAASSSFQGRSFNLGADYGRVEYHTVLDGPGARAELSGLYFGTGSQTLDQQITVVHAAPNCVSRQMFRGVLDDASTGIFSGGIDVRPGADGTDAEQANDNLLLSKRSEANTQPRLEILADEVICKHGATVGQLDAQALYYMRSRGIPVEQARRLLVTGFADQVMDDLEEPTVRAWVAARLGHEAVLEVDDA